MMPPIAHPGRWLLILTSLVATATIITVIALLPSPQQHRDFQRDQRVISDLHGLQDAINRWQQEHGQLPHDLPALVAQPGQHLRLQPADGGPAYRYHPLDAQRYRLCAHFLTDSTEATRDGLSFAVSPDHSEWVHGRGEHCFTRMTPDTAAPHKAATA